jgi:hypothetical protein
MPVSTPILAGRITIIHTALAGSSVDLEIQNLCPSADKKADKKSVKITVPATTASPLALGDESARL